MYLFPNELTSSMIFLQAADNGRKEILFGDSFDRACEAVIPLVKDLPAPSMYLEFPLLGDPFLDVTILYGDMPRGTVLDTPYTPDTAGMLDWYIRTREKQKEVNIGFEIDTKRPDIALSSIHLQFHSHHDLVMPFCEVIGEEQNGKLCLDVQKRLPEDWQLAAFGLFRGRPGVPFRVAGYVAESEKIKCIESADHLAGVLDKIGFTAYDDKMLSEISVLFRIAPMSIDYQFDVYPDGSIGDSLMIDISIRGENGSQSSQSFKNGRDAEIMHFLEGWNIVDDRWKLCGDMAFAKYLPTGQAVVLLPQWVKVRWKNKILQPAKMYCQGCTKVINII